MNEWMNEWKFRTHNVTQVVKKHKKVYHTSLKPRQIKVSEEVGDQTFFGIFWTAVENIGLPEPKKHMKITFLPQKNSGWGGEGGEGQFGGSIPPCRGVGPIPERVWLGLAWKSQATPFVEQAPGTVKFRNLSNGLF